MLATQKRLFKKWRDAEAEYKQFLAECATEEIPIAKLAENVDVERKTVYRHLGRSMT